MCVCVCARARAVVHQIPSSQEEGRYASNFSTVFDKIFNIIFDILREMTYCDKVLLYVANEFLWFNLM